MVNSAVPLLPDLVCLSHLRWNFVFQRPQHLLSRFARERRVFYVEEPLFDASAAELDVAVNEHGVCVCVPHLPGNLSAYEVVAEQRRLLDQLFREEEINRFALWFYTPMALAFARHLQPVSIAYDCMDELSAFKGAPPSLLALERELLRRADVVFTGGRSLFEAKRNRHPNVHAFPSSVDVPHFAQARQPQEDPVDQAGIPHPRLGFFGVLDERFDTELVRQLAAAKPEWQIILIGPVVKIDPAALPQAPNIHYLGSKKYSELPRYLAGWDVALMPFARNDSTRFISPTKTPEYLAAGKPVVSTSIRDVVHPYGARGLVEIADTAADFVAAIESALRPDDERRQRADGFVGSMSWNRTFSEMKKQLDAMSRSRHRHAAQEEATVND